MPLPILISLVVFGILGIAGLTWRLGMARAMRFDSDDAARRAFAREFPDCAVQRVMLCKDGSAAFLETARGPAIVWAMGADSTARLLDAPAVTRTKTGLRLELPDYTAPHIALRLSAEEADLWQNRMMRHP